MGPEEIAEYCEWALRHDGPMLYSTPTPMDNDLDVDDPKYQVLLNSIWFKLKLTLYI